MNPTWLFVAAVYAVAVALARRAGVQIPVRIALLFYLLVLGYLLEPMTGRAVNVQADVIATIPPWSFIAEAPPPRNSEMNDVPLQVVPWAHVVRESWRSLSAPVWNASTGCGMPLLGNGQSSALSPIRLIALPLNLAHSMTAEAAMKLLIALTFMYLYCRRHWSDWASMIAAVIFGFSGFMFAWLHFPHVTTACFLPAVFYAIDLIAERPAFGRCVFAGAIGAAIVFSGHPETAAHIFFAALLYVLWLRPPMKSLATMAGAFLIAVLLASPHLATLAESMTRSQRYVNLQRSTWAEERLPASDRLSAVLILLPRYFGPINKPWGPTGPDAVTGFAGALAVAAWFAVLWQVIASRAWRSRETFFILLVLLIFGAIFEWPGFTDIFHTLIPFGAHARLRVVMVAALAILAASAIDNSAKRRTPLLIGLGTVAALLIVVFVHFEFPEYLLHRRPAALFLTIPAVLVTIAAAVVASSRKAAALAMLFVAVVAEMWTGGWGFNPPTSESLLYPRTPIIRRLEQLQASAAEPFRIVGWGPMLFQNMPAMFGLEDMRVHDPMANARYFDFLSKTASFDPQRYFPDWVDTATHVLDFLNVRYLVADPGVVIDDPARYALVYEGPDGRIFENRTVLPRFYAVRNVVIEFNEQAFVRRLREMDDKWAHTALLDELELENRQMHDDFFNPRAEDAPPGDVKLVEAAATKYRLTATAPRYTLIVSSIPWWPGWKVERNGTRIEPIRVHGAFLGFAVPPGTSRIRVWYSPWTYWLGVWLAAATALALIAGGRTGTASR